jgi:hypothetical protein
MRWTASEAWATSWEPNRRVDDLNLAYDCFIHQGWCSAHVAGFEELEVGRQTW